MNQPKKRGRPPGPKKVLVEGEKKKLGRPKKVKLNEYGVPDNPLSKETGLTVFIEPAEKAVLIEPARFVPKNQPVLDKFGRILVEAKKFKRELRDHSADYPRESSYDPFNNPRFKSKNNLKMTFKFKKKAKDFCQTGTEDFWYSLFDGGYVKPDGILSDQEQLDEVKKAMYTLRQFKDQLERAGIYEPS